MAPLFDDLYATARAQGLPVRTLMSEYAPGQFEITLEHRADALRAVDEAILFKRAVRGVAARHGRIACFMAKPFAEHAGSGMHLHASLGGSRRRQPVAAAEPAGTRAAAARDRRAPATRWPTAWRCLRRNANSYRRFRSMSYAPVAPTWGINNRTVSLRVPAGPPASRHVEHRVAGADANPYLVAALVLGGMLHGIERATRSRAAGRRATAMRRHARARWLRNGTPRSSAAAGSDFRRGPRSVAGFLDVFLAIKRQECEKFGALGQDRDYEWYLETR